MLNEMTNFYSEKVQITVGISQMSKAKDTPEETRIFNIGMHYIQLIQINRIAGNTKMANFYSDVFLTLCNTVMKNPIQASKIVEDRVVDTINKVNSGRMGLKREFERAKSFKDNKAVEKIRQAYDKVLSTCEILNFCLNNHVEPPPVERQEITYRSVVIDQTIPPEILKLKITGLSVLNPDPKTQYALRIFPPVVNPTVTDLFNSGKVDFLFNFKCIRRNEKQRLQRLVKKSIEFELVAYTKRTLGKEKELVVAYLKIPMNLFSQHSRVSRGYVMENRPEAPKNEQYTVNMEISMAISLIESEYDDRAAEFFVIKQGAKLQLPWSKPEDDANKKRELSALSKDEILALKLKPMPKLDDPSYMPNNWLRQMIALMQENVDIFEKNNVIVPPKLIERRDGYKKALLNNLLALKEGRMTTEQYKKNIAVMLKEETAKAKEMKGQPLFAEHMERLRGFKTEYDSL
ncbi:hypothetical protein TRFO_24276 [Tritrichomonas foetus]|uniref:Uncharacterized protein n=1 Tax=Tritrichomonas foetus TaxID=1144522 RepID=A0A1J4K998_9EUKA|nr:hypothetical protein TRFO_24276 [Tritrichomonas foetus]|eukprot:OHT07464.1 hypothetical protein TRFO_24276 [Tritrichomonas foetus]